MNDKDDIISILSAIEEINNKPKKRSNEKSSTQNSIPKLNQDLIIPSDVDRIIREAEEYKKTTINYVSTSAVQKRTETSKNENIFHAHKKANKLFKDFIFEAKINLIKNKYKKKIGKEKYFKQRKKEDSLINFKDMTANQIIN